MMHCNRLNYCCHICEAFYQMFMSHRRRLVLPFGVLTSQSKTTRVRNSCFNIYHKVYKCPPIWTYRKIIHGLQVLVLFDLIGLTTVGIAGILFPFLFCLHPVTCWQCFSECNPGYHQPSLPQGHNVG